ncbi:hypothetical protein [Klebsiella aerogenes]|uniref:hypothetical protein n=1 Tax=Klebsiella aerogenes TaxID=548 RepID=UPI001D0CFFD6|nr:hypothetical protein [Klebsiella aerogenes]
MEALKVNIRKMTLRLLVSTTLLLASQCIFAASSCDISAIIKKAWPDAQTTAEGVLTTNKQFIKTQNDSPFSAICRIWPAHPELTLAAVPLLNDKPGMFNQAGDLELLVLDSITLDIRQRLQLSDKMSSDVFEITGLALDTARWKIAPDQTAFGLRIERTLSGSRSKKYENTLWLYAIEKNQLRVVINGLVLIKNDGNGDMTCQGGYDDTTRTVTVENTTHHGYADIRVHEKNIHASQQLDANGECGTTEKQSKRTWSLRYDGKQYPVPTALSPLQ